MSFDIIMLTDEGKLYVTEGIQDDFSTEMEMENHQEIKAKEEENVMDMNDKGKKIKSFAPILSVALVTACVVGSLSGYKEPVYAAQKTERVEDKVSKTTSSEKVEKKSTAKGSFDLADGVYKIGNAQNSNYVLDIASGSKNNGANVQLYLSNGTTAQSFKVTHDTNGYVTFTNVNSGRALDVSGGKVANYSNIQQYNSNGTKSQKWIVKKSGSGYTIISALDSNYVLDLSGGKVVNSRNIQLYQGNGSTAQQWTFEKNITERERLDEMATQNKSMMDDGVYYIKNRDVKFALDVSGGSAYSGANVQLYSLNKRMHRNGWFHMIQRDMYLLKM